MINVLIYNQELFVHYNIMQTCLQKETTLKETVQFAQRKAQSLHTQFLIF